MSGKLPSLPDIYEWDEDEMNEWPGKSPRQRPAFFELIFGAMIRTMAELHSNSATAYAMDKTKRYFEEEQLKNNDKWWHKWRALEYEFSQLPMPKQWAWRDRMTGKYPSLGQLAAHI